MKIRVYQDERWPTYGIASDDWLPEIEITEAEYEQIKAAEAAYDAAQKILGRAYDDD